MSRDFLTVGSTIRIPLLYRGEYSQWVERFMNYFEEQTDGEVMINSIKNGDQPLPRVTQVSISGTSSNEQPPLKDIYPCGLPNDIYSLINSNKTAKDLWDALARHMIGFEYGEQDRKAVVLYEYETFKAIEGELLLDTYIRYLQVINDLKKCGYSKDKCELNFKFLNNLQPEWKQYATMMRQNKNLMDINIDAFYNILKQNQGDVNDAMGLKKKTVVVTSDPLALIAEKKNKLKKITALLAKAFNRKKFYSKPTNNNLRTSSTSQSANKKQEFVKTNNKKVEKKDDEKKRDMSRVKCYNCKKEGHFAKDCKKVKVKDYEYYKTKMLLAKKDEDEQVLVAEDQAWMESSSDSDQEINANMVFMAQIKKVLSDSEASSSSADEKISEKRIEKANQQNKDFEIQNNDFQDKYDVLKNQATAFEMNNKDLNEQLKVLIEKNDDFLAQTNVLKGQLQVKHVMIDTHVKCQEKYAKLEPERYEYMIRYSAYFDNDKQHRKQIADQEVLYDKMSVQLVELDKHVRDLKNTVLEKDFKFSKLEECVHNKDLETEKCFERMNVCENKLHKMGQTNQAVHMTLPSKDILYNGRKGIGYTLMFLTHSNEALEIEKFKRARENKIEFAYDYGSLNASYVNEKINFSDDYFQEIINPDFEKIDSLFQQTSSLKLYVPTVILEKIIIDLEDEVVSLLEKEKANLKTIESLKSKDKFVRDPNKTPDSSQRPPHDRPKCGNPGDGLNCRHCALLRKKLKEVWFTICDENKIFQDFLNTSESSNENTNVVNAPQEPIVFNQDQNENSSQSPPHIDHHCCYGCGDSLDDENSFTYDSNLSFVDDSPNPPPQPPTYSYEFCENDAHYGHDYPPQMNYYEPNPCYDSNSSGFDQFQPSQSVIDHLNLQQRINDSMIELRETFQAWLQQQVVNINSYFPKPSQCQKIPIYYDDEDDEEDSFIMRDEHLDTIPERESDEFIKSSVENLVPNPNESEDLSNTESECDVPVCDYLTTFSNLLFDADENFSSSDDESFFDEDIDSLLDEFAGELIFLKSIPLGIDEADCDPEEEISFIEKFLYDNSSPRPPEEFNSENSDAVIESFSLSLIPVEDSDSFMEEIDLSLTPDDSMPPGIENDDYDSEGDILFLEELHSNDFLSLPETESFYFDVPSSSRPPAKPPNDDEIKPDTRILTVKVVGDISEHYVLIPRLLPTQPTLASNEEKSPHLLSHRGFKAFQLSSESPMMIYGGDNPTLDVPFLHFYPP
nr:hypothetical protein [Tanacetum cinerariifolium]